MTGEVSFEAADGFSFGFAFGCFAVEVDPGLGIGSGSGERDDVDRTVELAAAAAVQSVPDGSDRAGGDRGGAGAAGEGPVGGEALRAGGVADEDRRGDRAVAGLAKSWGVCALMSAVSPPRYRPIRQLRAGVMA